MGTSVTWCRRPGLHFEHGTLSKYWKWVSGSPERHQSFLRSVKKYISGFISDPERRRLKGRKELEDKEELTKEHRVGMRQGPRRPTRARSSAPRLLPHAATPAPSPGARASLFAGPVHPTSSGHWLLPLPFPCALWCCWRFSKHQSLRLSNLACRKRGAVG